MAYNATLRDAAIKKLDEAIAHETVKMVGGQLGLEEYKRVGGVIAGLALAKKLIADCETELMRG